MNVSAEIERLHQLFREGALNEAEFLEAKAIVLRSGVQSEVNEGPQAGEYPSVDNPYASEPHIDAFESAQYATGGTEAIASTSSDDKMWGVMIHLGQFAGYVIPFGGFLVPLIMWMVKRTESAVIDHHGRVVMNWLVTQILLCIIAVPLCFVFIGIPMLFAIILMGIVFAIIGTVKASEGTVWKYPFSLDLF